MSYLEFNDKKIKMGDKTNSVKLYFANFLPKLYQKAIETLPVNTDYVVLKTERDAEIDKYECKDLEEGDLASQIEVIYIDLPVLVKYRHRLTNLKWAHTSWNGVDLLMKDLEGSETLPAFQLTKTQGSVNAALISEYVIGYVIAHERSFFKTKEWNQLYYARARSVASATIGILGVGQIGSHLAGVCKSFGMTVWGLTRRTRTPDTTCSCVDVYKTTDELPELLQNCDYVVNILPSTPESRGLLSGDVLSQCKIKKSIFINVGRGDVVDDDCIVTAIKNEWLGGAVLDVINKEPLSPISPLWTTPGVIITPHVSGWSSEESHLNKVNKSFLTNYHHYIKGERLENVVDWQQGY